MKDMYDAIKAKLQSEILSKNEEIKLLKYNYDQMIGDLTSKMERVLLDN